MLGLATIITFVEFSVKIVLVYLAIKVAITYLNEHKK